MNKRIPAEVASKRFRAVLDANAPKKIVLHAGRVKTGSTFLQAAFVENYDRLVDAGWLFPKSLLHLGSFQHETRGLRSAGHRPLNRIASRNSIEAACIEAFAKELDDKKCPNILFSAELFGGDPAGHRLANLSQLLDGYDVEIVMYLRRPSTWVNSYYAERVTGGFEREHRDICAHLETFAKPANAAVFVDQCLSWNHPPKITFRNYEKARSTPDGLLGDIASVVGLPALSTPENVSVNRSPSTSVVRSIRFMNSLTRGLSGDDYKALYSKLLDRMVPLDDGCNDPLLSAKASAKLDSDWIKNNQQLVVGRHMDQADYEALGASANTKTQSRNSIETDQMMLEEVADLLAEEGVNGFLMPPTTSAIGKEFRRRFFEGVLRRLPWRENSWK